MYFIAFFLSFLLTILLTPLAKKTAIQFSILDVPDHTIKTHKKTTPYLGGASIIVSLLVTFIILVVIFEQTVTNQMYAVLVSSLIIIALGLIDDIRKLSPSVKLMLQIVAALLLVLDGISMNITEIELLDAALTVLWVVLLTNAFNIIDIMDGFAVGTALISSFMLFVIFVLVNEDLLSLLMLTLAGACLGFLKYNFNPAQIFMGDMGSLFLGYLLACSSTYVVNHVPFTYSAFILIFIFGVPLFDVFFVSVLRIKNGKSPLLGSKDHFALRLLSSGLTVKKTTLITYFISILLGLLALISLTYTSLIVYIAACFLITCIITAKKLSRIDMSNK